MAPSTFPDIPSQLHPDLAEISPYSLSDKQSVNEMRVNRLCIARKCRLLFLPSVNINETDGGFLLELFTFLLLDVVWPRSSLRVPRDSAVLSLSV